MRVYVKLLLTALFWGGAFVAGRHVSQRLDPFTIAFLRFGLASLLLLMLTRWREGCWPRLNAAQMRMIVVLGLTGVFAYNAMFFKGLSLIEAGRASLIIATIPVFIALTSALFFGERLGAVRILGILLSMTGAAIVVSRGRIGPETISNLGWGEVLLFGCVLSWVAYSILGKSLMRTLSPLVTVAYSVVVGTIGLFVSAWFEGIGA